MPKSCFSVTLCFLTEDEHSHADAVVRVHEREMLECAGHGKNFGTRLHAVEKRAQKLFGISVKGHPNDDYPRHKYEKGEGFP